MADAHSGRVFYSPSQRRFSSPVRRFVFIILWACSLVVAFVAGSQYVDQDARQFAATPSAKIAVAPVQTAVPPAIRRVGLPGADRLSELLERAAADELVAYLNGADAATRQRFRSAMAQLIGAGRQREAIETLIAYTRNEPGDAQAQFLLSDGWQMYAEWQRALEPLFSVLRVPPTPADATEARRRAQLLINAREQQLLNTGDFAELVSFFQWLTQAEPDYDGHRLSLVRWLLRSDEVAAAERLFKETGNVGVTEAARRSVAEEIAVRRRSIPLEREGAALYTSVRLAGGAGRPRRSLRLLIDTGASMTSLSVQVLQELNAQRLGHRLEVRTANSSLEVDVYRVFDFQVGEVRIGDIDVLALPELPPGVNGLLGMDVLNRFPKLVGTTGKPR